MIAPRPAPAAASSSRRRAAQQAQQRALGAEVEARRRRSRTNGFAIGPRPADARRDSRRTTGCVAEPTATGPTTGVRTARAQPRQRKPRQQRHAVDDDEPLDALGLRRRPRQPDRRAPVVQAQPHAVDARARRAAGRRTRRGRRASSRGRRACRCARSPAGRPRSRRRARAGRSSRTTSSAGRAGRGSARVVVAGARGAGRRAGRRARSSPRSPAARPRKIVSARADPLLRRGHRRSHLPAPRRLARRGRRVRRAPGGVSANVAVTAARAGAAVALAGGAGDDAWGAWLRDRLEAEDVGLDWFRLAGGQRTGARVRHASTSTASRPTSCTATASRRRSPALEAAAARRRRRDRRAVLRLQRARRQGRGGARDGRPRARARARPPGRLRREHPPRALGRQQRPRGRGVRARACPGAFLVKCNRAEARLMTGETQPEAAAASLLAAGAQHVIVTLGARGAILRARGPAPRRRRPPGEGPQHGRRGRRLHGRRARRARHDRLLPAGDRRRAARRRRGGRPRLRALGRAGVSVAARRRAARGSRGARRLAGARGAGRAHARLAEVYGVPGRSRRTATRSPSSC